MQKPAPPSYFLFSVLTLRMWMCPEKTLTLCSCPVSFGYQGPTGIPILGVSFSKGSKGRKTYLEKFPTLLCVASRDWASQCSLASIIVIYALAFGRVCVCCWVLAPHRRLTYFMRAERPDASTVHWRSGPTPFIWSCLKHTLTQHGHVTLHFPMLKAKWDIKQFFEQQAHLSEQEGDGSLYRYIEVHHKKETRASDAPVL